MSRPVLEPVVDDVYTLDLPRPRYPFISEEIPTEEPVSVHVVDGDARVLFGCGYASSAADLLAAVDAFGGVDVVVVEHADPDHYDAVPLLRYAYDDLTVAAPAGDVDALVDAGVRPDVALDHDEVRWGVRAIHVPGHTPGNMAFIHEASGTLVAGDTVVNAESPNAAPGDWHGAFAPMKPVLNADDAAARANLSRLTDYEFGWALLTHGPNVEDGAGALATLLDDLAAGH